MLPFKANTVLATVVSSVNSSTPTLSAASTLAMPSPSLLASLLLLPRSITNHSRDALYLCHTADWSLIYWRPKPCLCFEPGSHTALPTTPRSRVFPLVSHLLNSLALSMPLMPPALKLAALSPVSVSASLVPLPRWCRCCLQDQGPTYRCHQLYQSQTQCCCLCRQSYQASIFVPSSMHLALPKLALQSFMKITKPPST